MHEARYTLNFSLLFWEGKRTYQNWSARAARENFLVHASRNISAFWDPNLKLETNLYTFTSLQGKCQRDSIPVAAPIFNVFRTTAFILWTHFHTIFHIMILGVHFSFQNFPVVRFLRGHLILGSIAKQAGDLTILSLLIHQRLPNDFIPKCTQHECIY